MAPPSKLAVAISSVQRLAKEEKSYHVELEQQAARIAKLQAAESTDENADFQLRQERQALEETKKVLPSVQERLKGAVAQLKEQLEANRADCPAADVARADELLKSIA
ncbi:tubulin binding cofactor A [Eremomyces bilateralis CBS 781.70]|uniref:Tubulin-specific chaperone A n=1 Tax=Eremomyces bilateralis CBS 781.70 TaxID=1392243 RepID=A0A6G1FUS1_9PEZI|nr:tubulin binding cofactor A [Eremomyces bilateralis CBS 781.70]KAF1809432.1 tubulin binding cofactor A [Eremomyces bilateralis CBS 781.70]